MPAERADFFTEISVIATSISLSAFFFVKKLNEGVWMLQLSRM